MWHLYTDGACSGNPGPGGWGVAVYHGSQGWKELASFSGFASETTNNRMEMLAICSALAWMPADQPFTLHTDSRLAVDGFTKWLPGWQRRGWKKSDGKPVLNSDLWQQMVAAAQGKRMTLKWVRGHTGVHGNERADELATSAIAKRGGSEPPPFSSITENL